MGKKRTLSITISLVIHLIILLLLSLNSKEDKKEVAHNVPIEIITPEQAQQMPQIPLEELGIKPEPPPQEPEAQPPPQTLGDQIVETPETNDKPPEDSRLKSDKNSNVDDQTVARGSTEDMTQKPEPGKPQDEEGGKDDTPPEVARGEDEGKDRPDDGLDAAKGEEDGKEDASPSIPNLHPSDDLLAQIGGGGSVDYLPDVSIGDETALNTVMDRHAPFFNRVKRLIAKHWDPISVHQMMDPTGHKWGYGNKVTKLFIVLDDEGGVRTVLIDKSCGIKELDEEARQAVLRSKIFTNPPKDLIKNGKIQFMFGFHFKIVKN